MTDTLTLTPGQVTLPQLRRIAAGEIEVALDQACDTDIAAATALIDQIVAEDRTVYGVSTGFGLLANKRIPQADLAALQRNLVLSHCTRRGPAAGRSWCGLMLALKVDWLARGHSGVRPRGHRLLLALLNAEVYPVIPSQGSVGASGDLAPLAHLAAACWARRGALRRRGPAGGRRPEAGRPGAAGAGGPRKGLALLNGTQVSTALALNGLFAAGDLFAAAGRSGRSRRRRGPGQRRALRSAHRRVRGPTRPDRMAGRLSGR